MDAAYWEFSQDTAKCAISRPYRETLRRALI
jgi:hypothetical protein